MSFVSQFLNYWKNGIKIKMHLKYIKENTVVLTIGTACLIFFFILNSLNNFLENKSWSYYNDLSGSME